MIYRNRRRSLSIAGIAVAMTVAVTGSAIAQDASPSAAPTPTRS